MANILDTLKGAGSDAVLGVLKLVLPEPLKVLVDNIKADIDGGMTIDEAINTFKAAAKAVESYTGPEWDAAIESYIVLLEAAVDSVSKTIVAVNKK